jgi:hypothetical protein
MTGFRNKSWRRLGATLSGLALVLQLMLSSLGLAMAGAAPEPADAFGGHALCLAGGANPPAGEAPRRRPTTISPSAARGISLRASSRRR